MACDDVTSAIHLRVDLDDRLIDWDYYKITCGREINADGRLKSICAGKPLADIAALRLDDIAAALSLENDDDRFLLSLELEALQNAAGQYLGRTATRADGRYQVAAIACETDHIEIRLTILPMDQAAAPAATSRCSSGCGSMSEFMKKG